MANQNDTCNCISNHNCNRFFCYSDSKQSYDIPPGNIILATGQLPCRAFDNGALTTNLKYLVLLGRKMNPGPPRHVSHVIHLGYRCWFISKTACL